MAMQLFEDLCGYCWSATHPLAAAPFGLLGELVGAHQAELAERKAEAEQLKAGARRSGSGRLKKPAGLLPFAHSVVLTVFVLTVPPERNLPNHSANIEPI